MNVRRLLGAALTMACGSAAGAAIVLCLQGGLTGKSAAAREATRVEPAAAAPAPPQIVYVTAPAAAPSAESPPAAAPAPSSSASRPADVRETQRAATAEYWGRRLDSHEQEGRDARWAASTQAALQADLDGLGRNAGFQVRDVDCRTTTCLARLAWPSRDDAMRQTRRVTQAAYSKSCTREIYAPPPAAGTAGPYEGEVLFDCESDRTGP
jgi:hypothetical protein